MVPGSSGIGDGHGDHGIWRRGNDPIAALDYSDGVLSHVERRGSGQNISGDGHGLFSADDVRRVHGASGAAGMETGELDAAREGTSVSHDAQRGSEHRVPDAAILAIVGDPLYERNGRHLYSGT